MSGLSTYTSCPTEAGLQHTHTRDTEHTTTKNVLLENAGRCLLVTITTDHAAGMVRRTLQEVAWTAAQKMIVMWRKNAERAHQNLLGEDLYATGETWYTEEA